MGHTRKIIGTIKPLERFYLIIGLLKAVGSARELAACIKFIIAE